jgi:hypothetical protein
MRAGLGRRGVALRRSAQAGSRAFELLALSLAGIVPLTLTALAVAAAPVGLVTVSTSLVETARAWAQQYRRPYSQAVPSWSRSRALR